MIEFPKKRIYGLVGVPRAGKDSVADFLGETRGFVKLAFADKVKEEFGINKDEFEAAKISGDASTLRDDLWGFSESIKKKDPEYFIRSVISDAKAMDQSCVITDIRTVDEADSVLAAGGHIYWIARGAQSQYEVNAGAFHDDSVNLIGSKLKMSYLYEKLDDKDCSFDLLDVYGSGLFSMYRQLESIFFSEDIICISKDGDRDKLIRYMGQFDTRLR